MSVQHVFLCGGEIVRPTHALHHAVSPGGRDVFEPLYDVSDVAKALALHDNTRMVAFLKNNGKWVALQRVVWKAPRTCPHGVARLLIDVSGISFLLEHLLTSHKETHRSQIGFVWDPARPSASSTAPGVSVLDSACNTTVDVCRFVEDLNKIQIMEHAL